MVHPDEALTVLTTGISSLYRYAPAIIQNARWLEETSENVTESNEFSLGSSNSTTPSNDNDDKYDDDKADSEKESIGVLWLLIYGCAVVVASYVLYRAYRWWIRRRRILLSENASDVLGDLHMVGIPSQDFSDSFHEEDNDNEENDDGLL